MIVYVKTDKTTVSLFVVSIFVVGWLLYSSFHRGDFVLRDSTMNRLYESGDFSSSSSSDSDNGSTSDEEANDFPSMSMGSKYSTESGISPRKPERQNVLLKLHNREVIIDIWHGDRCAPHKRYYCQVSATLSDSLW